MSRLLLIEDDAVVAREVGLFLAERGHEVVVAVTGIDGLRVAMAGSLDLLIVDRVLPGMDGLSVLAELRRSNVMVPALVLSSLNCASDRIRGLDAGGDDYLGKPFDLLELEARVRAFLRRKSDFSGNVVSVGSLRMDLMARTATRAGRPLDLLPREFQILEYLARRVGQPVTRGMLFAGVWNYNFQLSANLVDVHVGKLRRKLGADGEPDLLMSVKGVGFVLRDPAAA